jgi:hypothetical protein
MSRLQNKNNKFPPQEFFEIISYKEDIQIGFSKEKPIVIGGQAINIWAQVYAFYFPELKQFEPFVSIDADLFGGKNLAHAISRQTGWDIDMPHDDTSIIAAILSKKTPQGKLEVDIIREVPGITEKELKESTKEITLGINQKYVVPAPSILLKAKIHNLGSINQTNPDGTTRNDIKHARMLLKICPLYLAHLHADKSNPNAQKEFDKENQRINEILKAPISQKVKEKFSLDFTSLQTNQPEPNNIPENPDPPEESTPSIGFS